MNLSVSHPSNPRPCFKVGRFSLTQWVLLLRITYRFVISIPRSIWRASFALEICFTTSIRRESLVKDSSWNIDWRRNKPGIKNSFLYCSWNSKQNGPEELGGTVEKSKLLGVCCRGYCSWHFGTKPPPARLPLLLAISTLLDCDDSVRQTLALRQL